MSVDLASISRSNVVSDERFSVLFAVAAHAACLKFERHPAGVVLLCLAEITGRCLGQIDNLGYSRFLMTLILFPFAADVFAFIRTSAITYSTAVERGDSRPMLIIARGPVWVEHNV